MHNVGQILTEYESEAPEFDFEAETVEAYESPESPTIGPEAPFTEEEEMELAAEMLEIRDEAQLDEFLGKLIKKAVHGVKRLARSPVGKQLFGILKAAAKKALPVVGTAVGGAFGGPAGAALGGRLATGAGQLFGLELEGLSPEDQEYEVARRSVRFLGDAAQKAVMAHPSIPPAQPVAAAARRHAPGMLRGSFPPPTLRAGCACVKAGAGRWYRRGRAIVLVGA